ncbi:alpha,alpha-trehalose-phosphate synthase (UDP-forming) [Luteimonas sp. BDR2-5]|uniref:alpha,alpha-trehalose-phosphate synthase (UDP-forming) n=1 Tax=Proluteimonas luteida TaxID=2878685 RepID=UPI001E348E5C|nr:alpha,alpha-trehalose-phosphate synthase (UDP-forming) [Luteimonas sp. BDR2-5]MCD9027014.1 alpha,alpha-trehalose-phosphate synthase (UDP-forming) [Luteimonas sp. BDR2-5]
MSRLVVVSNRVALPGSNQNGGLAVALDAALRDSGGLWFGWSGKVARGHSGEIHEQHHDGIDYVTVDLSREDYEGYYNGFSNRTLWPLLHFRLDLVDYNAGTQAAYRATNALFAEKLAKRLRDDDIIWVHDYHLLPLGQELRKRGVRARIGFFLHVPFPSADIVAGLPNHEKTFGALTAYDLVGFQTERDLERFQDYMRLFGGGRVEGRGDVRGQDGRHVRADAFPIGIDTRAMEALAEHALRIPSIKRMHASLNGRLLALGVDRLDYSKGLPERFRAFERFLEKYPDMHGKLTYLQIAPVSRGGVASYRALRRELEQFAGHLNGAHAAPDWTPVRYVNRTYPHVTLTGLYRLARVGLVTPLRDGMNLVAKEYIAAQDPQDPGVLVLSIFAGAARELDGALLVNPFDSDGVADAIATAATMPVEERRERWQSLITRLRDYDIHAWRRDFLDNLAATPQRQAEG